MVAGKGGGGRNCGAVHSGSDGSLREDAWTGILVEPLRGMCDGMFLLLRNEVSLCRRTSTPLGNMGAAEDKRALSAAEGEEKDLVAARGDRSVRDTKAGSRFLVISVFAAARARRL